MEQDDEMQSGQETRKRQRKAKPEADQLTLYSLTDTLNTPDARWAAKLDGASVTYFLAPEPDLKDDPEMITLEDHASVSNWPADLSAAFAEPSPSVTQAIIQLTQALKWKDQTERHKIPSQTATVYAGLVAATFADAANVTKVMLFFDPNMAKTAFTKDKAKRVFATQFRKAREYYFERTTDADRATRNVCMQQGRAQRLITADDLALLEFRERKIDTVRAGLKAGIPYYKIEKDMGEDILQLFHGMTAWEFIHIAQLQAKTQGEGGGAQDQKQAAPPDKTELLQIIGKEYQELKPEYFTNFSREVVARHRDGHGSQVTLMRTSLSNLINKYAEKGTISGHDNLMPLQEVILVFLDELMQSPTNIPFGMRGYEFVTSTGPASEDGLVESQNFIRRVANCDTDKRFSDIDVYLRYTTSVKALLKTVTSLETWFREKFPEHKPSKLAKTAMFFLLMNAENPHTEPSAQSTGAKLSGILTFYEGCDFDKAECMVKASEGIPPVKLEADDGSAQQASSGKKKEIFVDLLGDDEDMPESAAGEAGPAMPEPVSAAGEAGPAIPEPVPAPCEAGPAMPVLTYTFQPKLKAQIVKILIKGIDDHRLAEPLAKTKVQGQLDLLTPAMTACTTTIVNKFRRILHPWPATLETPVEVLAHTNFESTPELESELKRVKGTTMYNRSRMAALSIQVWGDAFTSAEILPPGWCTVEHFKRRIDLELKIKAGRNADEGGAT